MTEKRFTLTNPKNTFQEMKCGIDDRGNTLTFNEVVDLLNELQEENKELKQQLSDIDKLINDLGSEEMCRQYDEIIGDFE